MSIVSSGVSAIGRLAALGLLAVAFLFGLAGVVYMSLQGNEVKVPEITGKNFSESEKELALLGTEDQNTSDRASAETPNTVIEQFPKPGETVKTGQMILVVTSKGPGEAGEKLPTLKNTNEEDDTEKIEEMIDDKPKKPKSNSNTSHKKVDTARDVNANSSEISSNSDSAHPNSNKKVPASNNNSTVKPASNRPPGTTTKLPAAEPRPKPPNKP